MKQRILFTGLTGYIGRHLLLRREELKEYEILSYKRGDSLNDFSNIDIIVHLACNQEESPEAFNENKILLKELIEKFGDKNFIFISSIVTDLASYTWYSMHKKYAEILVSQLKDYTIIKPTDVHGGDREWKPTLFNTTRRKVYVKLIRKKYYNPMHVNEVIDLIFKAINN